MLSEESIAIVCCSDLNFITHIHLLCFLCLLWLQDNVTERREGRVGVGGCLPHGNPFLHHLPFFSSSSPSPPFSFTLSSLSFSIIFSHKTSFSLSPYCFFCPFFRRFHLQIQGTLFPFLYSL